MAILIVKKKIILSRNFVLQQSDMTAISHFSAKEQVKSRTVRHMIRIITVSSGITFRTPE